MLLVNLSNGDTVSFDFDQEGERDRWNELRRVSSDLITGLALKLGGVQYAIPLPRERFKRVLCDAGPVEHRNGQGKIVGDRLVVFADDIAATVLAYRNDRPKMVRFSIERLGRPVFLPGLGGG